MTECRHIPRPDEFSFENNDCTVRAISVAFKMTYEQTHTMLKLWGRKKGHGIILTRFMSSKGAINDYTFATRKYLKTINQFIKDHPKGTFLCRKACHAFTIIDGVVYGETKLRSIITNFWIVNDGKFVEQEKKPTTLRVKTQKQIVIELHAKGLTLDQVIKESGLKPANVKWYFNKLKLKLTQ